MSELMQHQEHLSTPLIFQRRDRLAAIERGSD
jgi:hypothetical protein